MVNGEEALAARAKDAVKSFTTRLHHQTEELKKESSRVALVAIRKARESLGRWDSAVAAWGKEVNGKAEVTPAPSASEEPATTAGSAPS